MDFQFTHQGSPCLGVYLTKRGDFTSPIVRIVKKYNHDDKKLGPAMIVMDFQPGRLFPSYALYMAQLYNAAYETARLFDKLIGDDPAAAHDAALIENVCGTPFEGLIDPNYHPPGLR